MYKILYLIGFLIRQFILPNPFEPFGESAILINYAVGTLLIPISYVMTGMIYERGDEPAVGSILFLFVYSMNTGITYLICLAYPIVWLMISIAILYLVLYVLLALKLRENR